MAFPKITDFVTYINRKLTGNDWNTNFQKIVNWLSLGDTDIKVKSIEADSIKYNGTTIVQNGNINTSSITANTVTANSFVGNGSQLTDIKAEIGFAYTPFAINSAKANFVIDDTTKITFDVSEENPLIVTTAKGKTITITSINDYDVTEQGNGTYYIFVDEETNGGTVYLKTGTIWRQNTAPSMLESQPADLWLDVSCEPYICRERETNNWYIAEYDKVPIGKVVISGGTITSLETLRFNDNGVNVFVSKYYENGTDKYIEYSNGEIVQSGIYDNGSNTRSLTATINFPKAFSDTNYVFLFAPLRNNSGGCVGYVGSADKTTTSIEVQFYGNDSSNDKVRYFMWEAKGKI